MCVFIHLEKYNALGSVYPITISTSSRTLKYQKEEISLAREITDFLSNQYEYAEGETDLVFDVCDTEIDKYISDNVNEAVHEQAHSDTEKITQYRSSDFCSKDFINEITVFRGLISLKGEEIETLPALIKLYFTGRDIIIRGM